MLYTNNNCHSVATAAKVIVLKERTNVNSLFVDAYNRDENLQTIISQIGKTVFPEKLFVKNFKILDKKLVHAILMAWTYGTKIGVQTPSGWEVFENRRPKKRFDVKFETLTTDKIPAKLYKMSLKGKTFPEALAESKNLAKFVPHDAWEMIQNYNAGRLAALNEYNKRCSWDENDAALKGLYKALKIKGVKTILESKLYAEAEGEIQFSKDIDALEISVNPLLTEAERTFLYKNAKFYGVEIPKIRVHETFKRCRTYNEFGDVVSETYAQYPEVVLANGLSEAEQAFIAWDGRRKGNNLPKDIREGYMLHESDDFRGEKKAYDSLMWLIHNMGDEALMAPYGRCPVCGEIYNTESEEGCENCGYHNEVSVTSIEDYAVQQALRKAVRAKYGYDDEDLN